jgi:hypothetical protein
MHANVSSGCKAARCRVLSRADISDIEAGRVGRHRGGSRRLPLVSLAFRSLKTGVHYLKGH